MFTSIAKDVTVVKLPIESALSNFTIGLLPLVDTFVTTEVVEVRGNRGGMVTEGSRGDLARRRLICSSNAPDISVESEIKPLDECWCIGSKGCSTFICSNKPPARCGISTRFFLAIADDD